TETQRRRGRKRREENSSNSSCSAFFLSASLRLCVHHVPLILDHATAPSDSSWLERRRATPWARAKRDQRLSIVLRCTRSASASSARRCGRGALANSSAGKGPAMPRASSHPWPTLGGRRSQLPLRQKATTP